MKLLFKLNVILVLALALVWYVQNQFSDGFIKRNEQTRLSDQALLMIQEALAVRKYTEDQIQPLVRLRRETEFHPQWVPFYATKEVFKNLKQQEEYKDFDYKETAINPTNPNDRADGWESNVIRRFQLTHDDSHAYAAEREDFRQYATVKPIKATTDCLSCHGKPQDAPPEMVKKYGNSIDGFGWQAGDIVGAQIVYVPIGELDEHVKQREQILNISRLAFFLVMLVIVNLAVGLAVIRPLNRLTKNADELSKENYDVAELNLRSIGGRDEISDLAESFNRLHRSVKIAMIKARGARAPE